MPKSKGRRIKAHLPKNIIVLKVDNESNAQDVIQSPNLDNNPSVPSEEEKSFNERCHEWLLNLEFINPMVQQYTYDYTIDRYQAYYTPALEKENIIHNLLKSRIEHHQAQNTYINALKIILLIGHFFSVPLQQTEARRTSLISDLIQAFELVHSAPLDDMTWLGYLQNAVFFAKLIDKIYDALNKHPEHINIFSDISSKFSDTTLQYLKNCGHLLDPEQNEALKHRSLAHLSKKENSVELLNYYTYEYGKIKKYDSIFSITQIENLNHFHETIAYLAEHPHHHETDIKNFSEDFTRIKSQLTTPDFSISKSLEETIQAIALFIKHPIQDEDFKALVFLLVTIRQNLKKLDQADPLVMITQRLLAKMSSDLNSIKNNYLANQALSTLSDTTHAYPDLFQRWFKICEILDLRRRKNLLSRFYQNNSNMLSSMSAEQDKELLDALRTKLKALINMKTDCLVQKRLLIYHEVINTKFRHLFNDIIEHEFALSNILYPLSAYFLSFKNDLDEAHSAWHVFLPQFLSNVIVYANLISSFTDLTLRLLENQFNPLTRNEEALPKFYGIGHLSLITMGLMGLFLARLDESYKVSHFYSKAKALQTFLSSTLTRECVPYNFSSESIKSALVSENFMALFKRERKKVLLYAQGFSYLNIFQAALNEGRLAELKAENIFNSTVRHVNSIIDFGKNLLAYWQEMLTNGIDNNFICKIESIIHKYSDSSEDLRLVFHIAISKHIKFHYFLNGFAHVENPSPEHHKVHDEQSSENRKKNLKPKPKKVSINNLYRTFWQKDSNQSRIDPLLEIEKIEFAEKMLKWDEENKIRAAKQKIKREKKHLKKESLISFTLIDQDQPISPVCDINNIITKPSPSRVRKFFKSSPKPIEKKKATLHQVAPIRILIPKAPTENVWEVRKQEQARQNLLKYRVEGRRVVLPQEIRSFMKSFTTQGHQTLIVGGFIHYILGFSPYSFPNDIDFVSGCPEDRVHRIYPDIQKSTVKENLFTFGKYELCLRPSNFDLIEDASVRDIPENAIYLCEEGYFYDPLDGLPRLLNSEMSIALIGDPHKRIKQDPVLILRMIDFSTKLDRVIDPLLSQAMIVHARKLRVLKFGEIKHHFKKLLLKGFAHHNFMKLIHFNAISGALECYPPRFKEYWQQHLRLQGFMSNATQALDHSADISKEYERVAYMFSLLLFPGLVYSAYNQGTAIHNNVQPTLTAFFNQYPSIAKKQLELIQEYLKMHCEYFEPCPRYSSEEDYLMKVPSILPAYHHYNSAQKAQFCPIPTSASLHSTKQNKI